MNWPLQKNAVSEEEINLLIKFLKSTDKYTQGEKVKEFEKNWSTWQGCKYSVFVNSGSSANLILIDSLKEHYGWKENDRIILPAITWATNISPIIQSNLEPIFVDIDLETLSFDLKDLKRKIEENENIKGIFITHLLGIPAEVATIKEICSEKQIKIFEDCCESHGAKIGDSKVGNFGEGSTFSSYFGHHMTSIEGGFVCTNNYELYKLFLLKRSHGLARALPKEDFEKVAKENPGIDSKFLFLTHGYNLRNTELHAVIGINQLKKLDQIIKKRNENFEEYYELCKKNQERIYLIKKEGISSFSFPFIFKEKEAYTKFKEKLKENSIEFSPIISGNLLMHPFLEKYKEGAKNLKHAKLVHENGIYIGNNQFVKKEDFKIINKILEEIQ